VACERELAAMLCAARSIRATLAFVLVLAPLPCLADTHLATVSYAHVLRAINPKLHEDQSRVYASALLLDSRRMHLDPRLVMAVVTVESGWNARALSPDGAQGLGQFLPETARELGVNSWSGRSNLRGITVYLHQLLGLFRSSRHAMSQALASYNVGPYTVKSNGGVPPRSAQRYVVKVMAAWHAFKARLSAQPTIAAVAVALDATTVARDQAAYWGVR
jgi:soluble lytic murein transglycosylase-like protein